MPTDSDKYVQLRHGTTVPVAPVLILFDLEARGLRVARDGDDVVVRPGGRLTPEDCAQIRRWKLHLLALLDYIAVPPQVQ